MAEALSRFSSCEVSDALVKLGVPNGGYIPDVEMFSPSRDSEAVKICGPAYTVKMVHASDKNAPFPTSHFVDTAPSGHIMLVSAPPQSKSAVWGGLMTAGAQVRGVLGVILDGRCRDLSEHRALKFPVFARGHSTLGQGTFTRPSELDIPLTIVPREENVDGGVPFPATVVYPGDLLLADIDGVVCIPKDMVEAVAQKCAIAQEIDEKCMTDIRAGLGIQTTFKKWRG